MVVAHLALPSFSSSFPSLPRLPHLPLPKRKPVASRFCSKRGSHPRVDPEGNANKITRISSIDGGCINLASCYDTDAGSFFVKTNRSIGPSMFEGEALGLTAMYETKTIRVPIPFKVGRLPPHGSYIIMEFVECGSSGGNQINTWTSGWIDFYGEHRLGYQLKLALNKYGDSTIYQKGQRLVKNMAPLFEDIVIEPCLLHGDLWSGNISSDQNGEPVILDPACYYGHSETEFGMSWCAGFASSFYNAYFEVMPKQPRFEKRKDLLPIVSLP